MEQHSAQEYRNSMESYGTATGDRTSKIRETGVAEQSAKLQGMLLRASAEQGLDTTRKEAVAGVVAATGALVSGTKIGEKAGKYIQVIAKGMKGNVSGAAEDLGSLAARTTPVADENMIAAGARSAMAAAGRAFGGNAAAAGRGAASVSSGDGASLFGGKPSLPSGSAGAPAEQEMANLGGKTVTPLVEDSLEGAAEGAATTAAEGFGAAALGAVGTAVSWLGPLGLVAGLVTEVVEVAEAMGKKAPTVNPSVVNYKASSMGRVKQGVAPSSSVANTLGASGAF